MTTSESEGLTAVLLQLAGITEKLAELDQRQASDTRALGDRVASLSTLASELKDTTASHARILAALDGLDRQVADLAAQAFGDASGGKEAPGYQPPPAPSFWRLDGTARDEAAGRLRAWVEQVYRPGYGHLAARLGSCWEQHPLCLYILDWLSELWSVLYLAPDRTAGTLAGQAEWHTRLLTAAADQLARETHRCNHATAAYPTAATGARP